jgi:putative mRNA 3-end processing factor
MGELEVTVHSAGHIPGAAMFELNSDKTVLFTGDINTLDTHLVAGNKPVKCDVLIIESTYSGRNHPPRSKTEQEFLEKTREVVDRGGLAIIPAFAVGRTQEMLMTLMDSGFDTWLDGMGMAVNREYVEVPEYLRSVQKLRKAMSLTKVVRNPDERKLAARGEVVLTTSGMLDGGPVLEYIMANKNNRNSAVLLTGFQVENTNGKRLIETGEILHNGVAHKIESDVCFYDFSAHADHSELVKFIHACDPETVVLCHGDNREELAKEISGDYDVCTPMEGEHITL